MQALVTGCAGFIGSRLTDTLLAQGVAVRGIDAFTTYYDPAVKHANVGAAQESPRFELIDGDLNQLDLPLVLDGVDVVYHLAGQPGVRGVVVGRFLTVRDAQRPRGPAPARSDAPAPGAAAGLRVELVDLRQCRAIPDHRDRRSPPALSLRGDQARGRAPLLALRRQLGSTDGVLAILQRVRAPPAPRHGLLPVL